MKQETKDLLIKYGVCFGVASLIVFVVFWIKGFFTDSAAVNLQILSDGFVVSGAMLSLYAGLLYVGSEGAFLGVGYILRNVILIFMPMGRKNHELYRDYRERKLSEVKRKGDRSMLFTGLFFLAIGVIFAIIWSVKYY